MMEAIFHHWSETGDEDVKLEVVNAFEMKRQSETDEIDLEHYLDTQGA